MSEDRNPDNYEALAAAFASIAPQWPGVVARQRQTPPVPTGKPAFWWLKADLPTLMRETAVMADAMTERRQ